MPPSTQTLRAAFESVASQWPRDALRPSLQFSDSIRKASDRIFHIATAAPSAAPATELSQLQQLKAEQTLASLQRLIENRALKAVRLSLFSSHLELSLMSSSAAPDDGTDNETRELSETLREDPRRDRPHRARRSLQEEVVPQL